MRQMDMKNAKTHLFLALIVTVLLLTPAAFAAAPGITGPTFKLLAKPAFITQPDGSLVYSWGYGCNGAPTGYLPATIATTSSSCADMQIPGPTLIVHEGDASRWF